MDRWVPVGIALGLAAACVCVVLFGPAMVSVAWLGDLFLRALKMLIVPLVMASMISGICGLGDVRRLGRLGGMTALYYAATTALAVGLGIALVQIFQPGAGVLLGAGAELPETIRAKELVGFTDLVLSFVSENIVRSMAEMDLLPVILFSLVFGGVLTTLGERGRPVIGLFEGIEAAIMKIVRGIMWFAPLGVFGLVAGRFAQVSDWGALLAGLGRYMATVVTGLVIHGAVVLPLLLWFLGRRNPLRYLLDLGSALLTAFSTASSSATLPLTLECVEERAGVRKQSARFVLPLGATINMDGTALYEAVAAVFIAQAYGVELGGAQLVIIFLTATLAAIGAAGIPEAGLVTMVIVLRSVGLPLEGIGLILAVDWLLDRFRTAVNVWGDAVGAGVVERALSPTSKRGQALFGRARLSAGPKGAGPLHKRRRGRGIML